MAKKKAKKKNSVKKKQKKKGLEKHEIIIWLFSTLLLGAVTMFVYWGLTGSFEAGFQELIAVMILSIWIFISALYIFPKFKRD